MRFCPKCKSLMFPVEGKMTCRRCGHVESGPIASSALTTSKAVDREVLVLDEAARERLEVMPKIAVDCPNCGHREAYYRTQQTRKSDEPETMFLRCVKCDHRWRKY